MKKTSVFPWTKVETDWLTQSIKNHPEWPNGTRYKQMKMVLPNMPHTRKATASKTNTLRPSSAKSKWTITALNTLAQLVSYEVPRSEMATYFNVTESAITHQLSRIKNLGLLEKTPSRQVNAHERLTARELRELYPPLMAPVEVVKQLDLGLNKIRAIDESVDKLISEQPRTATEMRTTLAEAEQQWGGTTQELILNQVVQVVDHLAQLMSNTLQLLKEEKCNSIS